MESIFYNLNVAFDGELDHDRHEVKWRKVNRG